MKSRARQLRAQLLEGFHRKTGLDFGILMRGDPSHNFVAVELSCSHQSLAVERTIHVGLAGCITAQQALADRWSGPVRQKRHVSIKSSLFHWQLQGALPEPIVT